MQEPEAQPTEVFIWGNGKRTVKSEYLGQYTDFEPAKIVSFDGKQLPHLKNIVLGYGLEAGIDQKKRLFAWKSKKQLSLNDTKVYDFNERKDVDFIAENVKQAAFSKHGLWVLYESGKLELRPVQDYDKELKSRKPKMMKNMKIDITDMRDIVQLSAGEDHVLALNKDGLVYCYGDDTLGQCGQGADQRSQSGPYPERTMQLFTQVKGMPP